MLPTNR